MIVQFFLSLPVPVFTGSSIASRLPWINLPADENTSTALVLLILFVCLALIASFMCSVAEAVLLSITPSYIEGLQQKNPRRAKIVRLLRHDNVDRSLAAILTMNTIAHTVGAIEAGAQAAVVFGSTWVGVFSAVMTLLILFLSEIIPKTLGAVYWSKLVWTTVLFVRVLIVSLYPLVLASEWITRCITRGKRMHRFSREEFMAMVGVGEKTGHIDEHESRLIRNLFRFGSLKATDIMTPRTVITALPRHATIGGTVDSVINCSFSRIPLYGKGIDDIKGFALKDEILALKSQNRADMTLDSIKREILTVPASLSLPRLLEFLLNHRQHIVVVINEYGGTKGLVTLEDVLETLLGMEIIDEMDSVADMRALARQQWAKRARALGLTFHDDVPGQEHAEQRPSADIKDPADE